MEYTFRKFSQDDKAMVQDFFDNLGGEARSLFDRNSINCNNAMKYFNGEDKNIIRWMLVDKTKMIGYLLLGGIDKKIPWLGIAIADDFKGRHLGRFLMDKAKDYAISKDMGGILLITHVANLRGQGLYTRMGYKHLGYHTSGELLYLLTL